MHVDSLFTHLKIEDCKVCGSPTHVALTHSFDEVSGVYEPVCQRCVLWFGRMVESFQKLLAHTLGGGLAAQVAGWVLETWRQASLRLGRGESK